MRIVLLIFVVYPIVWVCTVGGVSSIMGYSRKGLSCAPNSNAPSIMGIVQCFIAFFVLASLLGVSLRYIWQVVRQIRDLSDSPQNRKAWLTVRFIIIIILQTAPRFSYNFYYLSILIVAPTPGAPTPGAMQGYLIPPICYLLNAMVVVWGNKSLHQWLRGNVWKYISLDRTSASAGESKSSFQMESVDSSKQ